MKDPDGRRPEESDYAGALLVGEIPAVAGIRRGACERAVSRLGSKKGESAAMTLVFDNRAAGNLGGRARTVAQRDGAAAEALVPRGQAGPAIGSPPFDVTDDAHIPRAFGSRLDDNEASPRSACRCSRRACCATT